MKLDFKIAFDQQTRGHDRTFEAVTEPGARGTATPTFGQFWAQFCQITLTCSTMLWRALPVATNLLNTIIYFFYIDQNWINYEQNTIFGIRTNFDRFLPIH